MGRFRGDNGKPDDTGIKDLISPFLVDRSALTDGVKLGESDFPARKAVLVYGFDDSDRPLGVAVDTLDALLRQRVAVRDRKEAPLRICVIRFSGQAAWSLGRSAAVLTSAGYCVGDVGGERRDRASDVRALAA